MKQARTDSLVENPDDLLSALSRAVANRPDALFLDFSGEAYSYARFAHEAAHLAHGLASHGVGQGGTVASMLDNCPEAVLLWFGANMLGAIHVPINTSYKGDFLRHQIADSGAQIVCIEHAYLDRLQAVLDQLPDVCLVVVRGEGSLPAAFPIPVLPVAQLRLEDDRPIEYRPAPEDIACLVYTSGTTGPSKGCMLSHAFLMRVGQDFNIYSGRKPEELNWTALPLFHQNALAGTVVGTLLLESSASIYPRFSLSAFWPEIERTGARVVYIVGPIGQFIARMPDTPEMLRCKGQIRSVIAAPITQEVHDIFSDRFGVANISGAGYGQTEIGLAFKLPCGAPGPIDCNGKVSPQFEAAIFDEKDRPVPDGEIGEIVLRPRAPESMFQGYWRRPEATVKTFSNLWYHTGDLGQITAEGFLYFRDRKGDYLRRRGENISSMEVEEVFLDHPDVAEAAVHAVHCDEGEDEVKATLVLKDGACVSEAELCAWSTTKLPHFAVPRFIEYREILPRNPVGRVLKYSLRAEGATNRTWDRTASK